MGNCLKIISIYAKQLENRMKSHIIRCKTLALLGVILEKIAQRKIRNVWLGVWEKNPRAIAFYKKFGFKEAGEHVFLLGRDPQRDIILYKVLEV